MIRIHELLEFSRIAPTIDVARLTDLRGKTLAVSDNSRDPGLDSPELEVLPSGVRQQVFQSKNGQLEAVTPVFMDGKAIGLLWLEPNHTVSSSTAVTVVRICVTYGGFALLANLLPIFVIVRRITKPLRTLNEATHRLIQNPSSSEGFPLPVATTNEAGQLTISFNSMVRELEHQRNGLLETLALLDSMLGNAPIGFAFFDHRLQYVRVNEFLANTHGLAVDEHLGRKATEFYPFSLAQKKEACLAHVFETGESLHDVQMSGAMPYAPEVERSWLMHFYPVRTQQGSVK